MMTEIVLENLSKHFEDVKAVEDVNLTIKDREFTVLLGPSGCGKTTTLRLIAGLETPTVGNIYFDGELVNDLEPKERDISMVFQEYALYPHMKISENLHIAQETVEISEEDKKKRIEDAAEMLEIKDLLDRRPGELSGGQRQRAALGRSIVKNPSVYLFDEPLSNLDAVLRANMRHELKEMHKELESTSVYVTHDQTEAMMLADRIAVMNNGRLEQIGTPEEIYDQPATEFVANFVGEPRINLLDCSMYEKKGEVCVDGGSFTLTLPDDFVENLECGSSEILFGVRPKNVSVMKNGEGAVKGDIVLNQPMGDIRHLTIRTGSRTIKAVVEPSFTYEQEVSLDFDLDYVHFFDKRSGKRILSRDREA